MNGPLKEYWMFVTFFFGSIFLQIYLKTLLLNLPCGYDFPIWPIRYLGKGWFPLCGFITFCLLLLWQPAPIIFLPKASLRSSVKELFAIFCASITSPSHSSLRLWQLTFLPLSRLLTTIYSTKQWFFRRSSSQYLAYASPKLCEFMNLITWSLKLTFSETRFTSMTQW